MKKLIFLLGIVGSCITMSGQQISSDSIINSAKELLSGNSILIEQRSASGTVYMRNCILPGVTPMSFEKKMGFPSFTGLSLRPEDLFAKRFMEVMARKRR